MLERQMVEVESAQARDALQGADSAGAKELGAWHLRRQQQRPDLTVAQEGLGVSGAPRRLDLGRCQRCFALCRRRRLLLLPCGRPLLKPGHWPQRERGLGRRQRRRRFQSSTQLPPNEAQPNGRLVCVDRAVHQARGPLAWFDRQAACFRRGSGERCAIGHSRQFGRLGFGRGGDELKLSHERLRGRFHEEKPKWHRGRTRFDKGVQSLQGHRVMMPEHRSRTVRTAVDHPCRRISRMEAYDGLVDGNRPLVLHGGGEQRRPPHAMRWRRLHHQELRGGACIGGQEAPCLEQPPVGHLHLAPPVEPRGARAVHVETQICRDRWWPRRTRVGWTAIRQRVEKVHSAARAAVARHRPANAP